MKPAIAPGDVVLVRSNTLTGKIVRFGQRLRFHGARARYGSYTHAALITDEGGAVIEALPHGVRTSSLADYDASGLDYRIYHLNDPAVRACDRARSVSHASYLLSHHDTYGFLTIACIGLKLLFGSMARLSFQWDGSKICSQLVAECLIRDAVGFELMDQTCMPADLAEWAESSNETSVAWDTETCGPAAS